MNFRTTIILLILLVGVGTYLMFTSSKSAPATEQSGPVHLVDIASGDVTKLTISPAGEKPIVVERATQTSTPPPISPAGSDWKLTSPIAAYADAMKVSDLLDAIVSATSTSQVDIANNAADYGLDSPQITVELEAGMKTAKIDIGRQVKAGDELYIRVDDKNVAQVVGADLLDKLDITADKLRLARLMNADATAANWLAISRPQDSLTLEKSAGVWQMRLPNAQAPQPVEQSVVSDVIASLNSAQATGFASADDSESLLIGQPQATLTISNQAPTTQPSTQTETIDFGSPDMFGGKNVWVRVSPPGNVVKISQDTMDGLLKSSLDFRDRDVVKIDPADVMQLRIVKTTPTATQPSVGAGAIHEVVLARRPPAKLGPPLPTTRPAATQPSSVWQLIEARVPVDADDAKVNAALADFNPLHVDKFVASPASAAGRIVYTVILTTKKGEQIQIALSDPGENSIQSAGGIYNGLNFELPRTVISALDVDFAKSPTP